MDAPVTPPQILGQTLCYQGRKFGFDVSQMRLPNGAEGEWACVRHPGGSLAVPVTAAGELVLVRQYRFAAQRWLLEFPAGTIEVGEDPAETIRREIEEETGFRAHQWRKLGEFFLAPGYSDEVIFAYLATELVRLEQPPEGDADEDIEVVCLTPAALEAAIQAGEAVDAKTIASFVLARPYLS
jgi:ADP-ribose pyrophosphatase